MESEEWNSTNLYNTDNVVSYGNKFYKAMRPNTNATPSVFSLIWEEVYTKPLINLCFGGDDYKKRQIALYNVAYRERNSQVLLCECGSSFKKIGYYQHRKTKKHLAYITGKKHGEGGVVESQSGTILQDDRGEGTRIESAT